MHISTYYALGNLTVLSYKQKHKLMTHSGLTHTHQSISSGTPPQIYLHSYSVKSHVMPTLAYVNGTYYKQHPNDMTHLGGSHPLSYEPSC